MQLGVLLAAPLLLVQGLWVRRVTPRLPEAAGDRSGLVDASGSVANAPDLPDGAPMVVSDQAAANNPLRLLILGDSSAAGVGAIHQEEALAGRLSLALAGQLQRPVRWQLLARTGVDARGLIALLDEKPPEIFDTVLLVVGVNDVTGLRSGASWCRDLDLLLARLRAIAPQAVLVASGLPPMHRFPALPQPLRGVLGQRARQFDALLAEWTRARAPAIHVPIPDLDDPQLAAVDGFHPGPPAYRIWADTLALAMRNCGLFQGDTMAAARPAPDKELI